MQLLASISYLLSVGTLFFKFKPKYAYSIKLVGRQRGGPDDGQQPELAEAVEVSHHVPRELLRRLPQPALEQRVALLSVQLENKIE